jgi:ribonuclease D
LSPRQQAVLREIFILRDQIAKHLNRPPFKVMTDKVLIELAKSQPQSLNDLSQIKGVGGKLLHHNGVEILEAIRTGQSTTPPRQRLNKNHQKPDSLTMLRYESLRQWRNDLAAQRGVEPDVIISNHTLMDIARYNPQNLQKLNQLGVLGDWQRETYGHTLLNVLKTAVV